MEEQAYIAGVRQGRPGSRSEQVAVMQGLEQKRGRELCADLGEERF